MQYYLGLDQGTTGTTAILFDTSFRQVSAGYCEVNCHYPAPGLVEQDGEALLESLLVATKKALDGIGATASQIRCMGIDNQGETVILWDKLTGKPLAPAIVWQDRRTAQMAETLKEQQGTLFYERTGLMPDAYYGATKISWLLKNLPDVKMLLAQNRLLAGSLDTWFIWKLTGGKVFATDCVTASRTNLLRVDTLTWDEELLGILDIPKNVLPEVRENAAGYGETVPESFLGARVPITGSITDQQAALLGQTCIRAGELKTTYGTGCFMLMHTGETLKRNDKGILSTLALSHKGKTSYALDGGIYIAGAAVKWLQKGLSLVESPKEADELALSVKNNGGMYFVPAFTGLAAPHWDSYARGTMVGITAGCHKGHFARATLEATAYQVADLFELLKEISGTPIYSMRADGGGTNSSFQMQFQADLLGIPVEIPALSETTALGAAYLGALGAGEIGSLEEIKGFWQRDKVYEPKMSTDERESLLSGWHRAVACAKEWAKYE